MDHSKSELWQRFQKYYKEFPSIGLSLDLSRMRFPDDYVETMKDKIKAAFEEMQALEAGALANPDEGRMVGHYWLRNPSLAPDEHIRGEIEATIDRIVSFAAAVHSGSIRGQNGSFKNLLLIGIGGSSLGPQFVANALGHPRTNRMTPYFFDNTDPDGMERVLANIGDLGRTLCIVISKSGGTKETRHGMLEARAAYEKAGIIFSQHAVAITRDKSVLHKLALEQGWLVTFPMWDLVGGRTSELSAVGLLPAALQGIDIHELIRGAKICDEITRSTDVSMNPAAQLALLWFYAGEGIGSRNMVVLPYCDRLELFSKYLQQLVMESLGKERNRSGKVVRQGITVFGNKGATDQHSYLQQLRDVLNDFFATLIQVHDSQNVHPIEVDPGIDSADYLAGFLLGTRQALAENGREVILVSLKEVTPETVGALIALFERAVGYYATLIDINAYHQPGVEAGKKAAEEVVSLQRSAINLLNQNPNTSFTPDDIARLVGRPDDAEHVFLICDRLAARRGSGLSKHGDPKFSSIKYSLKSSQ